MTFDQAVEFILLHEGGLVSHPSDPGGITKFGISKRSYPKVDIEKLTEDKAKEIYKLDFWDRYHIEKFPKEMRLIFFDSCVNQGPGAAIKILQKVLGLRADGALGPITLGALKDLDALDLVYRYAGARLLSYQSAKNWSIFGKGWSNRLLDVALISMICFTGNEPKIANRP